MKAPFNHITFPYGLPTGSIHPHNSLAHTAEFVDVPQPLWQQRPSMLERISVQLRKLDTMLRPKQYEFTNYNEAVEQLGES